MYENIPSELLVRVAFTLVNPENEDNNDIKTIEHVNVQELVAAIRLLSQDDVTSVFHDVYEHADDQVKNTPTTMDERIRILFSNLVNGVFRITPDALTCDLLSGKPHTPAQSVMCTIRSLINAQKKIEKEAVAKKVEELFNQGNKKPMLSLPDILPATVPKFSVDAWIKSH